MELDTSAELTFCNKKKKNKHTTNKQTQDSRPLRGKLVLTWFLASSLWYLIYSELETRSRDATNLFMKSLLLHFQSKSKTNKTLFWTTSNSTSEQCPEAGSDRERPFTKILSGSVGWIPTLPHLHVWQLLSIKCGSQFCEKVCLEELAVTCQAEWKVRILLKKKKPWKDC